MSLSDPHIHIYCDGEIDGMICGAEMEHDLCALVQRSWDARHLEAYIKRNGWLTQGENHFCAECCSNKEKDATGN